MYLQNWYQARGRRFVWRRATNLFGRYGVTPAKAIRRIDGCLETLAALGCAPTFPTPGIIGSDIRDSSVILQDEGAEIARCTVISTLTSVHCLCLPRGSSL